MCYNVQLIDIVIESGNNSTGRNQYSYNENRNNIDCNETSECCTDSRNEACSSGYEVVLVMFILIQLLLVTIMVFIMIVFNIQLTNGFMIGLVFYCQMISIVYPNLRLNVVIESRFGYKKDCLQNYLTFSVIPANLFNLNFLFFLSPLCIRSANLQ